VGGRDCTSREIDALLVVLYDCNTLSRRLQLDSVDRLTEKFKKIQTEIILSVHTNTGITGITVITSEYRKIQSFCRQNSKKR